MASVHDIAAYILEKRGSMSTMKLQKLIYYSQAWHLVWVEEPLFAEDIQAWANGPVVYEVFGLHRGQFSVDAPWPAGDSGRLNPHERGTVDAVLQTYGGLSGRQLSALSHNEDPWRDARAGLGPTDSSSRVISLDRIADFYGALDQDPDAPTVADLDWSGWTNS